ncbi:hypothetical protein [Flavobacterium sp. 3HN19-14]|uniref:hypothetical protein n=1 Tax=Flavobacterium sp. 3HN19-14 TaxID=3448133 RepID=UPI003EE0015F
MKNFTFTSGNYASFYDEENTFENDNYIDDITKIEEDDQYDRYNFFPDASF